MSTDRIAFRRVWWPLPIACLFAVFSLWGAAVLFRSVAPWYWIGACWLVFAAGALVWIPCRDLLTQFTHTGLVRPTLAGMKHLRWTELRGIDARGTVVRFRFARGVASVNLLFFHDQRAVIAFIRSVFPSTASTDRAF